MQTIIRVEHPADGYGIWRSKINGKERIDSLSNYFEFVDRHNSFPLPYEDKLTHKNPKFDIEFCAFKTVESLQEWIIDDELKEIITMGFKVLLLDVSECIEGEYQVLFKKTNILQTKDISNLFI